ncbi:MFS transporter [Kitasatospora sp. NPDC006697]|uniref:MFS transporter n=1 Tax=Kitasatospora sp. NPDC006697 TaxID=3364020 RepID=UPI0036C79335
MTDDTGSPSTIWRHREFLLLWGGQAVSELGSQVTLLALPLVAVVLLGASTFQVGLLSTAITSAYLLVALPAGAVVDRKPKRALMMCCDAAQLLLIGSVPAAQALGVLSLGQLYAVALLSSVFAVFFSVAYQSYLPTLLRRDQLMDGNGKLAAASSFAQVAGPSLGAGLVAAAGAAGSMTADAASYALSAVSLLAIRTAEPAPATAPAGGRPRLREEIRAGLRYLLRDPILRNSVAFNGTANFFVIMVETLGPLFLVRTLHLRPGYVGLLLALGAVGGIVGGLCAKPLARRVGTARISWVAMTVLTLPGLLIPLARSGGWVVLFGLGWISWTFAATLSGISLVSYRQAVCPPELLGRVSAAARWINWGTLPLGALVCGLLGSVLGIRATLWLAVVGGCAAGLWLYFSPLRGMRDIPLGRSDGALGAAA